MEKGGKASAAPMGRDEDKDVTAVKLARPQDMTTKMNSIMLNGLAKMKSMFAIRADD